MAASNATRTLFHKQRAVTAPPDLAINQLRRVTQETVYQAEWQWFRKAILPPLRHSFDMEKSIETLTNNHVLTLVHNQLRWSAFADCPPTADLDGEGVVFCVLRDIISAIHKSSNTHAKKEARFFCKSTTMPYSSARDDKSKSDAYFLLNDNDVDKSAPRWSDIVIPAEFKKDNTDESRSLNATQVLCSLTHIMREDPRRRFVIGFTIENFWMRLWVATRTDVLVSYPIDLLTDIEKFIDFVLRISFSQRDELGFDHTIMRLPTLDSRDGPQYEILVNKKWYRTQRLISDVGAEALRGRGTRAWEVRELDKRGGEKIGPPLVVKDSWVDAGRDREATILQKIRKSATTDVQREAFDAYLIDIKDSWDVLTTEKKVDSTRRAICRRSISPTARATSVEMYPDEDEIVDVTLSRGAIARALSEGPGPVMFAAKVHHRVLFGEVGKTIMEAGTLGTAFLVLADVIMILRLLHQCGWVHRDVSAGNVLIIDNVGKLVDFEYAKHESDDWRHKVRMGTPYFTAVEVERHRYSKRNQKTPMQRPPEKIQRCKKRKLAPDSERPSDEDNKTRPKPYTLHILPVMPFRHNPLHDLESVLWLALYIVLCSTIEKWDTDLPDEQWANYSLARYRLAAKVFDNSVFRADVVGSGSAFYSSLSKLHPTLQAICIKLNEYLVELVNLYMYAEQRQMQAAIEAASAGNTTTVPDVILYTAARKTKFYRKAAEIFRSICKGRWFRANEKDHISFKPTTIFLSEQQREMIAMLEAVGQLTPAPTLSEEEDTRSEPPKKIRKLNPPRSEEVAAASRVGGMR
ncbi:uncharacterized protein PHACADRAFT_207697 [Phanerochaete carnosa HHB-10118-sp]|uniref:Fungal-type protein kinase domain-containing protein n=1 Tax=Phanerochaete carnosa (strain HHB-10118-sp) TaxID=650164 RepID=K5V1T5_PHACS|nr:uncharacterized protein PHACADRAFT_207697 [Phanerochaete carnosa HHB-10118-sp]EKM56466.1 hypothetical protein PHACADRAFT_207697 [Phanerochaete carnosa HHB-10118-sp]